MPLADPWLKAILHPRDMIWLCRECASVPFPALPQVTRTPPHGMPRRDIPYSLGTYGFQPKVETRPKYLGRRFALPQATVSKAAGWSK